MQSFAQTYDVRKYPICCPTNCAKGAECERFIREFLLGAQAIEIDAEYTLDEVLLGSDRGGDATGAEAHPGVAPHLRDAEYLASTAKRTKRLKLAAAKIEKYFLDKNLHATLTRLYGKDGREMWKAYISACKDDQDDQATSERKINIMASTILSSVGFGISSVSKYKAFLDTENTAIEPDDDRISEAELSLKLLREIGNATIHLKVDADKEIKRKVAERTLIFPRTYPVIPLRGTRSTAAIVDYYEGLWDALVKANQIPTRAISARGLTTVGNSTRVDGLAVDADVAETAQDAMTAEFSYLPPDVQEAFAAAAGKQLPSGRLCWNCWGMDHLRQNCPSHKVDGGRSITAMIALLTSIAGRMSKTSGEANKTRRTFSNGNRRAASFRPRSDNGGADRSGTALTVDGGIIYNNDGVALGSMDEGMMTELGITDDKDTDTAQGEAASAEISPEAGDAVLSAGAIGHEDFDDITVPYDLNGADEVSVCDECEPDVPCDGIMLRTIKGCMHLVRLMISLCLMLVSGTPLTAIAITSGAAGAHGAVMTRPLLHTSTGPLHRYAPTVQEMTFIARGYSVEHAMPLESVPGTARVENLMKIDSGADGHYSFTELDLKTIDTMMPRIQVRVANGVFCPAAATGPSEQVVNAKYRQSGLFRADVMRLSQVTVVPALCTRLFSPAMAFERDGISTFLNDARRLSLPGGTSVQFHEPDDVLVPRVRGSRKYFIRAKSLKGIGGIKWGASRQDPVVLGKRLYDAHAASTDSAMNDDDIWHARLMHFGEARVQSARGKAVGVHGVAGLESHKPSRSCNACALGGMRRRPLHSHSKSTGVRTDAGANGCTFFGERVSSDLSGPFPPSLIHGFTYAIDFYDWYTGDIFPYFLKSKSAEAVLSACKQFQSDHGKELKDGHVHEWHKDNGGEFTSASIDDFCAEIGIRSTFSIPWMSNTNAYAERAWGILLSPMRKSLAFCTGGTVEENSVYWPWLMEQAAHVHRSLPSRRFEPSISPYEKRTGKKPDLSDFHVPLYKCFVRLEEDERGSKLSNVSVEATHICIDQRRSGGWYVYIPSLNRLTTAYHVEFRETEFLPPPALNATIYHRNERMQGAPANVFQQPTKPPTTVPAAAPATTQPVVVNAGAQAAPPPPAHQTAARNIMAQIAPTASACDKLSAQSMAMLQSGGAMLRAISSSPSRLLDAFTADSAGGTVPLPRNRDEALAGPWSKQWRAAMDKHMEGKLANDPWVVEHIPAGTKVVKGKWVFAVTYNDDGSVDEFKARWVACGYSEIYGLHYEDTCIGTLNATTARAMFCKAAACKKPVYDVDISKAFTTADIDYVLYVQQPVGFEVGDKTKACRLLKALEGTKQAGHLFYKKNAAVMTSMGFKRCDADPCLWYSDMGNGEWIYIGVFVDDLLCLPSSKATLDKWMADYRKHFKITGGEETTKFVGIGVARNAKTGAISINQGAYIKRIYDKYMRGKAPSHTFPIGMGTDGAKRFMELEGATTDAQKTAMAGRDYLGLIGSLLYVSNMTRPDVAFHVSFLAQFMSCPTVETFDAALGVLAYLYKTADVAITYEHGIQPLDVPTDPLIDPAEHVRNHGLVVFSDASYGSPRIHGGHVVMLCNGAIAWTSSRIKVICTSSMESEICAGVAAAKDTKFIRNVTTFLGMRPSTSTPLIVDNEGMWFNVRNAVLSSRNKHWELWQHYLRKAYMDLVISIHKTDTDNEWGDVLTKAIPKVDPKTGKSGKYFYFRNKIMNINDKFE